jgi:hypothetical protein
MVTVFGGWWGWMVSSAPVGNRRWTAICQRRRVTNPPQVANLPHKACTFRQRDGLRTETVY